MTVTISPGQRFWTTDGHYLHVQGIERRGKFGPLEALVQRFACIAGEKPSNRDYCGMRRIPLDEWPAGCVEDES